MSNNQALQLVVGGGAIAFNQPIDPSLVTQNFESGLAEPVLPKLSIKGSRFTVRIDADTVIPINTLTFDVVMIGARSENSRAFYTGSFSEGQTESPDCSSVNGFNVDPGVKLPQAMSCQMCPNAAYGTASRQDGQAGKGQACRQYRQVVVIPYAELWAVLNGERKIEEAIICTLQVPPASLKLYAQYVKALAKHGGNPTIAVTRLGFVPNTAHPQLTFQFVQPLTAQEQHGVLGLREREDFAQAVLTPERTQPTPVQIQPNNAPQAGLQFVPPGQSSAPSLADAVRNVTAPTPAPEPPPVVPSAPTAAPAMQGWPAATVQQAAPTPAPPVASWPAATVQQAAPVQPPPTTAQIVTPPSAPAPSNAESGVDNILARWSQNAK